MTNEEATRVLKLERASWSANPNLKVAQCLCDAYDMAIKALEQTRWIPVSERLPEKDGKYLVAVRSFCGLPSYIDVLNFATDLHKVYAYDFPEQRSLETFWILQTKCGFWEYDAKWGCNEVDDVIAWMPLPEPYKEESEE